jgi:mannose-1-phosphate guanylyltransferase
MLGRRTMIQSTVDRLGDLAPAERVFVATTGILAEQIARQLPELPAGAILVEPCKRDTGPCIALAAIRILRDDPEAIMAVMPSDHVIGPDDRFRNAIRLAAALVEEDPARMVTFGIRPTYAAESFGYVERGEPLRSQAVNVDTNAAEHTPGVFEVRKFHEKPKADVAEGYLKSGGFYWNSGIFVWKARTILDAIYEHQPEMRRHLERIAAAFDSPAYEEVLAREFALIEPISIDLGVMEHVSGVVVVEAPFDWDDVGSWRALERLHEGDAAGNVVDAARYLGIGTSGSIIRAIDEKHVIVTVGVKDLIVIVTPDATLVADKNNEESIRQVTKELERRGWTELL